MTDAKGGLGAVAGVPRRERTCIPKSAQLLKRGQWRSSKNIEIGRGLCGGLLAFSVPGYRFIESLDLFERNYNHTGC